MAGFNPMYLLLIVPALAAWYAQSRVRAVYKQYEAQPNATQIDGRQAARRLLHAQGLDKIAIEQATSHLTDHYDPRSKTLRLSEAVGHGQSLTSLAIVAHEVGHAIQDASGYHLMRLRTRMAERVQQVAQLSSLAFVGGMLLRIPVLMGLAALILFSLLAFTMVTLPVERDASKRALAMLESSGMAGPEDRPAITRVLRAAAFTYLAALGQRLASFLFFVMLVGAARGA